MFSSLQESQVHIRTTSHLDMDKLIFNLTDDPIDPVSSSMFIKRLKYAPKTIQTKEIICAVNVAVKELEPEKPEKIRQYMAGGLGKSQQPKSNISKD